VSTSLESSVPAAPALSERQLAILEFERRWFKHAGPKEEAIREDFALSPARYYQILNAVIDSPDAVRHDPMLIKRLQRARDARAAARAERAFTSSRQVGRPERPLPDETTD
jgi:hypothetical protein